jgi:hypothetical protein
MAKGGFNTRWKGDKKFITIDLEDKHQIKIKRPKRGDPDSVEGADGPFDKPPELDLNNLPPDTVILTHTNPTCGYYYWNGRWWYR